MPLEGFKRKFAAKNQHPEFKPKANFLQGAVINPHVDIPPDAIVLEDRGKKHFSSTFSGIEQFKPAMRLVDHQMTSKETRESRKKAILVKSTGEEIKMQAKRHFPDSATKRSVSVEFPVVGWHTKKTVLENGKPAYKKESDTYLLEGTMNRKQRVPDDATQRNDIPIASLGDKPYYQSDREPGFHAKGGLVVGSTIAKRKSAKPTLRKSEDTLNNSASNKKFTMTYAEKQAQLDAEYDVMQVRCLTLPSTKQDQVVPSWEERTGNFLVDPEDENY